MDSIVNGKCYDYAHDGKGVVKVENYPIFVHNLLVGEEAVIKIKSQHKGYYIGQVVERKNDSVCRVKPICENYHLCGGCHLQHFSYIEQLRFKRNRIQEALKRIGNINVTVNDVIGTKDPYYYRNKVQVPFGVDNKGKIIAGFYKYGTHDIVDINQCYIEDKQANVVIQTMKQIFINLKLEMYNEDKDTGNIRHVLVRKGIISKEIMVVIITKKNYINKVEEIVNQLIAVHPNIKTIVHNINPIKDNIILGNKEVILYGPGYIEDYLCGLKFQISPKSFYQINHQQTEVLYHKAIELANLSLEDHILDAYCGIGTIGLIAAKHCKSVVGVENVESAIKNAKKNAQLNKINNISFQCADATKFILENKNKFDAVFIDPPRNGCDKVFINSLINMAPAKIIYISCEPSSLARDLSLLSKLYDIKQVQPVDMFSQTYHVETITVLCKK